MCVVGQGDCPETRVVGIYRYCGSLCNSRCSITSLAWRRDAQSIVKFSLSTHKKSGDNKGTVSPAKSHLNYFYLASNCVRQHHSISVSYSKLLSCHGRGRGFESRRPRHHPKGLLG